MPLNNHKPIPRGTYLIFHEYLNAAQAMRTPLSKYSLYTSPLDRDPILTHPQLQAMTIRSLEPCRASVPCTRPRIARGGLEPIGHQPSANPPRVSMRDIVVLHHLLSRCRGLATSTVFGFVGCHSHPANDYATSTGHEGRSGGTQFVAECVMACSYGYQISNPRTLILVRSTVTRQLSHSCLRVSYGELYRPAPFSKPWSRRRSSKCCWRQAINRPMLLTVSCSSSALIFPRHAYLHCTAAELVQFSRDSTLVVTTHRSPSRVSSFWMLDWCSDIEDTAGIRALWVWKR